MRRCPCERRPRNKFLISSRLPIPKHSLVERACSARHHESIALPTTLIARCELLATALVCRAPSCRRSGRCPHDSLRQEGLSVDSSLHGSVLGCPVRRVGLLGEATSPSHRPYAPSALRSDGPSHCSGTNHHHDRQTQASANHSARDATSSHKPAAPRYGTPHHTASQPHRRPRLPHLVGLASVARARHL